MPEKYLSARVSRLTPYTAGEQPRDKSYIKLNTNENPYPPSPRVKDAVLSEVENLHLYPDPDSYALRAIIAQTEENKGLTPNNVFCGNGSDEVLSFIFYAFFGGASPALFPDIAYSFYPVYARFYDIAYRAVPLDARFEINPEDYTKPACGVIIPNPNAPTSVYLDCAKILKIAEYHKGSAVVAVDEAYIAFTPKSASPSGVRSMAAYINDYPNLIIIRTLSKSHSLAGLRLGYCIAQPHIIETLRRVKDSVNSYPVDRLASAAAIAALSDTDYFNEITKKITAAREWLIEQLDKLGFYVLPAAANFVFCTHKDIRAAHLKNELKRRGVLVRHWDKPRIDNYLRITVGDMRDMETVTGILHEIIQKG